MFGERLSRAIKKSGKSQEEFAAEIGTVPSSVSRWVNGKQFPRRINVLEEISRVLDVSVAYLLGEEDPLAIEEVLRIPLVANISLFAGQNGVEHTADVNWDLVGEYMLPEKDFQDLPENQRESLFAFEIRGDSMSPRFCEGDRVIFAKGEEVFSGDLALVFWGSEAFFRGIVFEKNGSVVLRAICEGYQDLCTEPGVPSFCIIGKALAIIPKARKAGGLWS